MNQQRYQALFYCGAVVRKIILKIEEDCNAEIVKRVLTD